MTFETLQELFYLKNKNGVVDPTLDIIFDTSTSPTLYDRVGNRIDIIKNQTYTAVELLFMDDYLLNG